jgi:hypothetical protein
VPDCNRSIVVFSTKFSGNTSLQTPEAGTEQGAFRKPRKDAFRVSPKVEFQNCRFSTRILVPSCISTSTSSKLFHQLNSGLDQGNLTMVSLAMPTVLSPVRSLSGTFRVNETLQPLGEKGWVCLEKKAYLWQMAVQAAIDENEGGPTEAMVRAAEVTIFERIRSYSSADDGEGKALFEALCSLRALKRNPPCARAVESLPSVITGTLVPSPEIDRSAGGGPFPHLDGI